MLTSSVSGSQSKLGGMEQCKNVACVGNEDISRPQQSSQQCLVKQILFLLFFFKSPLLFLVLLAIRNVIIISFSYIPPQCHVTHINNKNKGLVLHLECHYIVKKMCNPTALCCSFGAVTFILFCWKNPRDRCL